MTGYMVTTGTAAETDAVLRLSPEAKAFAFGAMLHREYGSNWPRLIGVATGAAMRAERDAMGDV